MNAKTPVIGRPQSDEYVPYYENYIALIPDGDILAALEKQSPETARLLSARKEAEGDLCYLPGKWSVKEVLGHVIDTERVFSYRALRIARNDRTPMEGFEQDDYVKDGPFSKCSLAALVVEFRSLRLATLSLFPGLDQAPSVRL